MNPPQKKNRTTLILLAINVLLVTIILIIYGVFFFSPKQIIIQDSSQLYDLTYKDSSDFKEILSETKIWDVYKDGPATPIRKIVIDFKDNPTPISPTNGTGLPFTSEWKVTKGLFPELRISMKVNSNVAKRFDSTFLNNNLAGTVITIAHRAAHPSDSGNERYSKIYGELQAKLTKAKTIPFTVTPK